MRLPHKFLQRGGPHGLHILEPHVIRHQRQDLFGLLIRKPQPPANLLRHFGAHFYVAIEADAAFGAVGRRERRRLAHIVQKSAPSQSGRNTGGKHFQHHQRVNPDVAFGMPLRFLLAADERNHLGQHLLDDAEVAGERESN